MIRWGRRIKPLRNLKLYIRRRYRVTRIVRRQPHVRVGRRWCRVLTGKYWYYKYGKRWIKIGRPRLTARVARRTYRIRQRRRKLYMRIGRRSRLVLQRFVRYIRVRKRRVKVKRKRRGVVLRYKGRWNRRVLRVKRFRK